MALAALGGTVLAGYLIGSIPVAAIVARRQGGPDLRTVGDHNPGYWNAKAVLGGRAAVPVFVGDTVKGVVAAALGRALAGAGEWELGYAGAAAAMIGHAWPVFAAFRGGRSVLTFAGVACVLSPLAAAISIALLLVVTVAASFASGARIAIAAYPVVQLIVDGPWRTAATGALMCIIGIRFVMAARTSQR